MGGRTDLGLDVDKCRHIAQDNQELPGPLMFSLSVQHDRIINEHLGILRGERVRLFQGSFRALQVLQPLQGHCTQENDPRSNYNGLIQRQLLLLHINFSPIRPLGACTRIAHAEKQGAAEYRKGEGPCISTRYISHFLSSKPTGLSL